MYGSFKGSGSNLSREGSWIILFISFIARQVRMTYCWTTGMSENSSRIAFPSASTLGAPGRHKQEEKLL